MAYKRAQGDNQNSDESQGQPIITPLEFPKGYVPGQYAPWYCSTEDAYGPDELGLYVNAIEEMTQNVNKCDAAARIWEVLQAWEARLFRRNYHFLNAGWKGWGMFGGTAATSGASIMQTQNSMKLFSCNVYGARHKKIVSLLAREVPAMLTAPVDDSDPMDQAASEEAEKYLKVFNFQADLSRVVKKSAGYFYTDGRVGTLTYTVADQTRWGTEIPDAKQETYGAEESEGVSPETEMDESAETSSVPARREVTFVGGKLEWKVPLMADEEEEMGWIRYQHEVSNNLLKAKYPWIADKIAAGGNVGGMDQIDRMARINVRLAVQASSSSGEAYKNDATETVTFFRPSEYWGIEDENVRQVYFDTFPDGLEVWHAGGSLAMVRNCRMSRHVKIVHPYPGDGQNRESIGTNYLPLQKVLNANISLLDRYNRNAIARRYALEPYIDTQLLNSQSNDPAKVTPVTGLQPGMTLDSVTSIEKVPVPNNTLQSFIQWLIEGAPEAMDGGTAAAFGEAETGNDEGVYKTTRLKRDQALQVFAMPWNALCEEIECISLQALESAAENRVADISASLPGQQKMKVELEKIQGSVLIQRSSDEIPQTLAEEEEAMAALIAESANVAVYQQLVNDPANMAVMMKFPSLRNFSSQTADSVEQQQGEFEILMRSGPVPNPQLQQIEQQIQAMTAQIQQGNGHPEAATPEGQQMMQTLQQQVAQLTQAAQALPPMVSTVPVAQDNSENHTIHASITLGMLTSPTGRKLKNGNEQQQQIWQNIKLHWQEHMAMVKSLAPPKEMDFKGSVTIDPSKFPPQAQSEMFQAMGLEVPPFALQTQDQTHEITTEKEGVDENNVPYKQKVSVVGKPLS
jgi:hypothetical protein